jgi:2-C-methyl-D-erythritol 2,4-cyclodiphosphate synthase
MRIGHGYDVHKLQTGDHVFLGGVKIPFNKSLIAHSDGDVLLHAICDAILGAAGLGDIGRHFSDNDPQYAGISSRLLLTQVGDLMGLKGFSISNIDATVICEGPKIAPFNTQMVENIANDLKIASSRINIKGTTTERLGFLGRGEGIAAIAVCILDE